MRRVSKKQAAINRALALLVKDYLKAHPRCEYMMDDVDCSTGDMDLIQCPRKSTHVHHIRGRGKYTLDVTTFFASCDRHHPDWIHVTHVKEAKRKGYLK